MRKRYLLLLMTILFGLALLAVDNYTQEGRASLSDHQVSEPDYYGEGLLNRRFDDTGRLEQRFSAQSSTHYPLINSTTFDAPVLQLQDEDGDFWKVSADEGSLSDKDDLLRLRTNVVIRPLLDNHANPVVITTESLEYFTKRQLAKTKQQVTITYPQTQVTAIGMTMDMKKQRMELQTEVNTQYVPQ